MGPILGPKIGLKSICWGAIFGSFFEGVGTLLVALGSLLGPSQAVLEGLGPQKHLKTAGVLRCFQLLVFGTLRLLMGILGPSWPLLGRSGPKMGSKMGPQMAPNRPQNHLKEGRCKLKTIKNVKLSLNLGLGFEMVQDSIKMTLR